MTKKDIEKKIATRGWAFLTQKEKDYYYSSTDETAKGISEIIYNEAIRCLGRDISPKENEYGCQESVNTLLYFATGQPINNSTSTAEGLKTMKSSKRFQEIKEGEAERGTIIICATGTSKFKGARLTIKNGHIGVVGDYVSPDSFDKKVMSNDSKTSLWKENYTLASWKKRYVDKGGYPLYFFRVLS